MDRRASLLSGARSLAIELFLLVAVVHAQSPSRSAWKMTVAVDGTTHGTGFIVGNDDNWLYIVTVAHVVGAGISDEVESFNFDRAPHVTLTGNSAPAADRPIAGSEVSGTLKSEPQGQADRKLWIAVTLSESLTGTERVLTNCAVQASAVQTTGMDAALLRCPKGGERYRFSYDLLGDPAELKPGTPLMLIGNFPTDPGSTGKESQSGFQETRFALTVPAGYFLMDTKDIRSIEFLNVRGHDVRGASGGPLFTERSEFIGMVYQEKNRNPTDVAVSAIPWQRLKDWLKSEVGEKSLKLTRQARTAAPLRRSNIEFSVAAVSLYVPSFGWMPVVPDFRIASAIPNAPSIILSFDFTYAKTTIVNGNSETLSLAIPDIAAAWQIGANIGFLRRRQWLGGVYLGSGLAPVGFDRSLTGNVGRVSVTSWTGMFEAGWRYRLPGRSWGFTAAYREGVLFDHSVQQLYPRLRQASYGLFLTVK